uniref:CHRD domain-containing protein n=1 Tax=Cystobacterineae bacterium TaxID=1934914 RepID=A0A1P8VPZ0_9BACT|nr:uncharacterized protein [Cystobacterineae bacterium]
MLLSAQGLGAWQTKYSTGPASDTGEPAVSSASLAVKSSQSVVGPTGFRLEGKMAQSGDLYFNLHTTGQTYYGDIRGQLLPAEKTTR